MYIEKIIGNLFKRFKKKNIDTSLSGLCHFSNSEAVLAHHYLTKIVLQKNYFIFFISFLKHIYGIAKLHNIKILKSQKFYIKKNKKIKIFISWGNKNSFDSKGNFRDRITGVQSNNKNIYFFIIYEGIKIPRILKKNIALVHINESKNYFFLFKFVLSYIFQNLFRPSNLLHYLNYASQFSLVIFEKFNILFKSKNITSIHFPYEGQQFQNYLVKKIKEKNKKIKFVGYLSHMHSFQTDVFKREGAPDVLYLFSPAQKKYLKSHLGWSNKQLKLIYSYRLEQKKKNNLCGNVYFSYKLNNKKKILNDFKYLLNSQKQLPNLNFLKHPNPYNKKDQEMFKKNLLEIYQQNKARQKNSKKKIAIVIGISTSIFFLLEHGIEVIHFHSNNYLEKLNPRGWKNIKVKEINDSVSIYKLKRFKTLIKMKKTKKILKLN